MGITEAKTSALVQRVKAIDNLLWWNLKALLSHAFRQTLKEPVLSQLKHKRRSRSIYWMCWALSQNLSSALNLTGLSIWEKTERLKEWIIKVLLFRRFHVWTNIGLLIFDHYVSSFCASLSQEFTNVRLMSCELQNHFVHQQST